MNIVVIGASKGIGKEVCLKLAESSENKIIAVARDENALKNVSEASKNQNIIPAAYDIADYLSSVKKLKKRIEVHFSRIDILLNNSGYLVNKPFEEHTPEEIASVISVNLTGIAFVIKELLPLLKSGSHVVNIGSMGGFQGSTKFPGLSWYSAVKGALAVLTECLATEYAGRKISFNCLCPGAVDTGMFRKAFPGFSAPVTAEEMGEFIAYFAVNGNRFFNGKIIPVACSVP